MATSMKPSTTAAKAQEQNPGDGYLRAWGAVVSALDSACDEWSSDETKSPVQNAVAWISSHRAATEPTVTVTRGPSADTLNRLYGKNGHPLPGLSIPAWSFEVQGTRTQLGYWDWVVLRITEKAKPDLSLLIKAMKIEPANLLAFQLGYKDGVEQGLELSMGMTYPNALDQWCYDGGSLLGALIDMKPSAEVPTAK